MGRFPAPSAGPPATLLHRFWRRFLPDLVQRVDLGLFRRISQVHHPAGDAVLPRLSRAANHSRLWMVVAGTVSLLGGRAGKRAGLRGMLAVGLASFLANVPAKLAFNRTRPQLQVPVARRLARLPASTSFPSGHSASAFAFATGLSMEHPALAPVVFPLAAAVAYSRVYTGVHYPSDVVAGAVLGAGAALATRRVWRVVPERPARTVPAPSPPLGEARRVGVVVNLSAGSGDGIAARLQEAIPEAEVAEVEDGGDLPASLRHMAGRCDVLGIAGGDGSVGAAAGAALAAGIPLLILPTGTLNRCARELGISTMADAVRALRAGRTGAVDVGKIDGEVFVNIASVGAYVALVEARERIERTIGRWPAVVIALVRILRRCRPVVIELNGEPLEAWMILFGNCAYVPDGLAPSTRPRLEDGRLDLRVALASHPFSRLRLVWATLTGTLPGSKVYRRDVTDRPVRVRSGSGPLLLSRDGETFGGSGDFTVEKADRRLRVLVPPS